MQRCVELSIFHTSQVARNGNFINIFEVTYLFMAQAKRATLSFPLFMGRNSPLKRRPSKDNIGASEYQKAATTYGFNKDAFLFELV